METIIKSPAIADETVKLWPISSEELNTQAPEHAMLSEQANELSSSPPLPSLVDETSAIHAEQPLSPLPSFEQFWNAHHETLRELESKAAQEGYEQGLLKGEAAAQQANEEILERLHQILVQGQTSMVSVVKDAEALIGAIVFEVVCKIVGEQLLKESECHRVIAQVIHSTLDENILQLKVSLKDFEKLQVILHQAEKTPDIARLARLPLQADPNIELGGCLVYLKDGKIDGRIETQFRLFAQSLKEAIGHG